MKEDIIKGRDFRQEFSFYTSRSSGPGGQNVNKVNTRVELRFYIPDSQLLTDAEKIKLLHRVPKKMITDGAIMIVAQNERSQVQNKNKCIEKFYALLIKALTPRKKRIPTQPSKTSKEQRLKEKRITSEKKIQRKDIQSES